MHHRLCPLRPFGTTPRSHSALYESTPLRSRTCALHSVHSTDSTDSVDIYTNHPPTHTLDRGSEVERREACEVSITSILTTWSFRAASPLRLALASRPSLSRWAPSDTRPSVIVSTIVDPAATRCAWEINRRSDNIRTRAKLDSYPICQAWNYRRRIRL